MLRRLIGRDDALHQGVAHDVAGRQAADGDIRYVVQNAHGVLQTTDLVGGQIDLCNVAGDDDLRAEAQSRQEHFHLLARRVLRLVEDDEAVVERAAAHIGQRRDLDVAALEIFLIRLRAEHIVKRVIQRTEIRIDLVLQVAGQEPEPFARLYSGARQNDAVDRLLAEGRHGRRHGEVCLAGTGRTDADRDGIFEMAFI